MRRLFIILFIAVAVQARAAQQPNIVIFFSDDHTQQAISAYQNVQDAELQDLVFKDWAPAQTPNIDRIAANGALFRNSYVCNSICGPSRANLMTGLHSHANGHLDNLTTFDGSQQTFPKLLQAADYDTSLFGKWHLKTEPTGFDHYERLINQGAYYNPKLRTTRLGGGYNDITYTGEYVAEVITEQAIAWLQDRIDNSETNPFLMFVNHKGTHRNWQPGPVETNPPAFRQVEWDYTVTPNPDTAPGDPASWTPAAVPVPPTYSDHLNNYPTRADGARLQTMEVATDMRIGLDLKLEQDFGGTAYDEVRTWYNARKNTITQAEMEAYRLQRYLKDYILTSKSVDRGVGDVLNFLEANNLDRNTIIIYSSDQGFFLGEHGWFDKRWMYEESFRTPLLMQWKDGNGNPLIAPGSLVDEMVQVIDYGPTVLEAAGVTIPEPMHGESFLGFSTTAAGDEPASWRDALYYHYYEGADREHTVRKHYGIFDGRYKLIYQYEGDQWEMFDLQTDPLEVTNLFYHAASGTLDDPTDGIEGTEVFQTLVTDLLVTLRGQRTLFNDTTGSSFIIPGIDPVPQPDPNLLAGLLASDAVHETTSAGSVSVSQPEQADGFTQHITFIPAAADLTGTVLLIEIGGCSNGSGLYLVDGVPTFIQKQSSSDPALPDSLNDTELPEVAVQSGIGTISNGVTYRLTAMYTPPQTGSIGNLKLAIQPLGAHLVIDEFGLTNVDGGDWSGNKTISVGTIPGGNNAGGMSTTSGVFDITALKRLAGDVVRALYWNATGAIINPLQFENISPQAAGFHLWFSGGIKGETYRLLRDNDLPIGVSNVVIDALIAGDGPDQFTDDGDPHPLPADKAFYRVIEGAE